MTKSFPVWSSELKKMLSYSIGSATLVIRFYANQQWAIFRIFKYSPHNKDSLMKGQKMVQKFVETIFNVYLIQI